MSRFNKSLTYRSEAREIEPNVVRVKRGDIVTVPSPGEQGPYNLGTQPITVRVTDVYDQRAGRPGGMVVETVKEHGNAPKGFIFAVVDNRIRRG